MLHLQNSPPISDHGMKTFRYVPGNFLTDVLSVEFPPPFSRGVLLSALKMPSHAASMHHHKIVKVSACKAYKLPGAPGSDRTIPHSVG